MLSIQEMQECWSGLQSLAEVSPEEAVPDAGFLIATIGKGKGEVEAARIELREATIEPLAMGMLRISGGFEVVSRLLLGYDVGIERELASVGIDVADFKQCAEKFQAMPNIRLMPLRDAVDFVHFLVYSAIRLHRYRGAPSRLGGPIEIAVVTADRGFRWVVHKSLQGSIGIPGRNELHNFTLLPAGVGETGSDCNLATALQRPKRRIPASTDRSLQRAR